MPGRRDRGSTRTSGATAFPRVPRTSGDYGETDAEGLGGPGVRAGTDNRIYKMGMKLVANLRGVRGGCFTAFLVHGLYIQLSRYIR